MYPALMLLHCLFALLFVGLVWAADDSCALQLEQALFRPKVCGIEYFEKLSCELNSQLSLLNVDYYNPEVAKLCRRFAAENEVQLSILNAKGVDMCILNDLTANLEYLISKALNVRAAADRRTVYVYYQSESGINYGPAIPSAESPDLDSIGIFYVFYYVSISIILNPAPNSSIQVAQSVLDYISTFPEAGPQGNVDLYNVGLFALYTASVTRDTYKDYFESIYQYIGYSSEYNYGFGSDTAFFLTVLVYRATLQEGDSNVELPLNERLANYKWIQSALLEYQGIAGIVKSFAQPLPINTQQDGLCRFGYNLPLPMGKMVRIVFGQTDLLLKKKK